MIFKDVQAPSSISSSEADAVQAADGRIRVEEKTQKFAGVYLSGESPRIVSYGFFFNYVMRLPVIALFLRMLR